MGFMSKLFRNRRLKLGLKQPVQSTDGAFQPQATDHQFDKENIRFIIFRDHDLKGRSVLFDSLNDGIISEAKSSRNSTDLKNIADMMFGTLPMSHKTTTLKVHSRKSPPQLMITKVFIPQRRSRESTCSDLVSFDLYSIESLSADDHIRAEPQDICSYSEISRQEIARSVPLDVPVKCFGGTASRNVNDLELSTSGTHSLGIPSVGSVASLSSSYSSRDRRRRRHRNTTIEHLLSSSLNDEKVDPIPLHKRPTKIGVAVIFLLPEENSPVNKCFQTFFFSHIVLIENYVHRLKGAVDQALAKRSEELIREAMKGFLDSVSSLYRAPRLKDPAWLSMMTFTTRRFTLSSQFLKDFMMLVERCHTKNTKFFFGVLVTAVLTHHLSWAPTVAPVEDRPSQTYLDKHAAKWVNSLLRSHPYNPLWVQLGDLYGAVGVPLCLSRTVVVGRKQELVSAILFILSYFIRCSEILENIESFPKFSDVGRSRSGSETSSIVQEDEATLVSPVSYSKDGLCACIVDSTSSCTTSILKSISEKSDCQNCNSVGWSGFRASDLDACQCCPGLSDCAETCEAEARCRPSMLLARPSDLAPSSVPLDCPASLPTDNLSPPTSKSFNLESPSSNSKKKRSLLSLQLEQPCRLKEDSITESPKHECIRNVGSVFSGRNHAAKALHHVALGDEDLPKLLSEFEDPELSSQAGFRPDTVPGEGPMFGRGLSMFDEYFESEDPDVDVHLDVSLLNAGQCSSSKNYANSYGAKDFGDIMDVPCPDLSSSSLDRISRTSANFESGVDFEESTELYSEHFGGTEIENVAFLPDGPSKQNLHKAISMLQDQFTVSGHGLEADCLCLSSDGMHEQADRSAGHSRSKEKRHDSGQSATVSANRCRSVTLSESSCNMNDMTNYMPVPLHSSSELSATDISSGCIYLSEECNFGRSLLGDYCSSYTSHFVLHGTSDRRFLHEPYALLHQDLKTSVQNSVLDEPVAESTCIVADADNWNVQLFSCKSKYPDEPLKPLPLISSPLVCNLIESVYELAKLKMSPEFCLLHLEDQLQSIYLKSQRLAEYIRVCRKVYSQDLATLLNLDINDMPLLLAISRTHSPQLFRNL